VAHRHDGPRGRRDHLRPQVGGFPLKDGKTLVAVGGTFNRLHAGHRLLLSTAFQVGDQVFVGVTSDSLVGRLRRERALGVRPYPERDANVRRLLAGYEVARWTVAPLDDPYIPSQREEFDAIVVSPETVKTAEEINALRELRGYPPIKIVTVPWLLAFDGKPISSTRILAGEIDEDGRAPAKTVAPKPTSAKPAKAKLRKARKPAAKPAKAAKKRKATGKKAAAKSGKARSGARRGSRAGGPRSRR
jgi:pantetheine-phosphate adenylyltransferase